MEDIDKQKVVEEILAKKNKKKQNVEQYKDFLSLSKEGQEKVVRTIAQLTAEQHAEQHYT